MSSSRVRLLLVSLALALLVSCVCSRAAGPPTQSKTPPRPQAKAATSANPPSPAAAPAQASFPRPDLARGASGVVAADHPLASKVGLEILQAGGDAVDAAVATALALGVVNPQSSGIGGGGFLVAWRGAKSKAFALDFREMAPAATHRKSFLKEGLAKDASRFGGLAVGVPGEVAGLYAAHQRWGKLPWSKVVAPAVQLAKEGFAVGEALAHTLSRAGKQLDRFGPLSQRFRRKDGAFLRTGDPLQRPDLANTLQSIAEKGPDAFYRGPVAAALVKAAQDAGGVLTPEDLANYKVRERAPLQGQFRGQAIWTMPPPSSGGAVILSVLAMLEARPDLPGPVDDPLRAHLLCEALKHAFADRASHFGDPDFGSLPLERLLNPKRLKALAKGLDASKTLPSDAYGMNAPPRDSGTSHLSIIDAQGNAVALTSTVNTGFGSLLVAGKSGVVLNNEMDDFTTLPGKPNAFGLLQSELNTVAPGKRPLSSMSPTIVVRDGRPVLVVGGSGGPRIITGTLAVLLNVLVHGDDLASAVGRPRLHHQWLPDQVLMEEGAVLGGRQALEKKGHKVKSIKRLRYGVIQAAGTLSNGARVGASDLRKHGRALAY